MSSTLEICAFNLESALTAQRAGAHRVEFCADPTEGGTTPGFGSIRVVRERLQIPLYPIIRPRGGDFLFSEEEFEVMLNDISLCKQVGCDGVVIGILQADGSIDKKRCEKMVSVAYPMGVTFHRAFDWCANPFEALEDIITIGCERILTSGQRPTAWEGAELIGELVRQAAERIVIMPGSGLRAGNIGELKEKTQAEEFHASARVRISSRMEFVQQQMPEDLSLVMADEQEITGMLQQLAGT